MEERAWNATSYRFGFNSMEHDDELNGAGNSIEYEYRIHDPRLGRFLSVDPLAKNYPWNSTYAFAENDVIRAIDLEGLEKWITQNSELVYGPFSSDYIEKNKFKSIYSVVKSDELVEAIEMGQQSVTFVELQKRANLYGFTTIKNDEINTKTHPVEDEKNPGVAVAAVINIDKGVSDPNEIFTNLSFEMSNAVTFNEGSLNGVTAKAVKGKIKKKEYVMEMLRTEARASINALLIDYETGGKMISEEQYNSLNNFYDLYVEKKANGDYDHGIRVVDGEKRLARDVYGEKYDEIAPK